NPTKQNNDPKPDPNPTYPIALTLEDIGSKHLTLWTSSSPVAVEGLNWTARVPVEVSIPDEVAANLEFQKDGAQIVGHLKMTTPGGSKLDTVTDVIVKIHLVHPT